MKNWEALKAYNEGKKIRSDFWSRDYFISLQELDSSYTSFKALVKYEDGWSIVEEEEKKIEKLDPLDFVGIDTRHLSIKLNEIIDYINGEKK